MGVWNGQNHSKATYTIKIGNLKKRLAILKKINRTVRKNKGGEKISLYDNVIAFSKNINSDTGEHKYSFSQNIYMWRFENFLLHDFKISKKFDRYTNPIFKCLKLFQQKTTTHLDLKAKTTSRKVIITRNKTTTRNKREKARRKATCKEPADRLKTGWSNNHTNKVSSMQLKHKQNYYALPRLFHSLEISFFKSTFLTTGPGLNITGWAYAICSKPEI